MKTLEELYLSKTPWKRTVFNDYTGDVVDADGYSLSNDYGEISNADAALIAAAPELYNAVLWCYQQANDIGAASLDGSVDMKALSMAMAGIVRRCEKALQKAGDNDK